MQRMLTVIEIEMGWKRGEGGDIPSVVKEVTFTKLVKTCAEWLRRSGQKMACSYSWTIVYCERCRQHIGWRFSANNAALHPRNFWGITRTGIQSSLTDPRVLDC